MDFIGLKTNPFVEIDNLELEVKRLKTEIDTDKGRILRLCNKVKELESKLPDTEPMNGDCYSCIHDNEDINGSCVNCKCNFGNKNKYERNNEL